MLCFRKTLPLTLLLFTLGFQTAETNPKVEQLYDDAKDAQAAGDLPTAIAKYQEIIHLAPKLGLAYNNLGALYFRHREFAQAAKILEQGLRVNPNMTSSSALLGISLFESADYARARQVLESTVKANPNDANAQLYLAKDLIKLDETKQALAVLDKLAAKQPSNQEVYYLMARVHMRMSEQALAKMNAIDPNSVLAHQLSAEVMESMNNYDGAVVELKKAVALAPSLAGNHYKLGDAYWNLSAWDQAAEQFKAELAVSPGNCMAEWKLGNILLQKNAAADEALSILNSAVEACPTLADARLDRARALAKLDRNQEALADLEAAVKANPNDPTAHFVLAKVYRALGRGKEAAEQMQIFSKLDDAARAATAERAQEVIRDKQGAH